MSLTDAEHRTVEFLAEAMNVFARDVCGDGATRPHDIAEFASRVHDLQARVLACVAAREYPDRYRLPGASLNEWEEG